MNATQTITPAGTWSLDPVHSIAGFEVGYLAGTFKGSFDDVSASLTVGEDGRASLEGVAQVASVDVKDETLNAHLQSPDFFDAESYPELRFSAEDLRLDGDRFTADGEITIKGVTKPTTVTGTLAPPIDDPWGNKRLGLKHRPPSTGPTSASNWNNPLPSGDLALANEVDIVAELQFVRGDVAR